MSDFLTLVDQFGAKIPRGALSREISAPNYRSARPPFEGHLAFGMNPQRLGSILRAADNGSTLDWMILAEEIEELFPHYYAVLSKRRRQVAQLPITVSAAGDVKDGEKHADFVRKWLDTKVLKSALFDVLDAVGKGYSASEIMWESKPGQVWPVEIAYRSPRFFELSWEDGRTLWLRTETGFEDLAAHKFLLHRHQSKSGGPVRSGLTRAVAFLWMFSTYTLRDWATFTQAYGLPVRVGTYGPGASEPDKRVLWRAVSSIAGDLAAIIPKSMEITFIEPKGKEGTDLYPVRANWLNYEVSKLVLGGTGGTDAIAGGHAVGQEHRAAEQDVERFDADLLQNTIDQQLVQTMIAFTFGPQEAYPTVSIGRPEQVPMSDVIAAVADLGPLGFTVKASEVRDRLQLTKPEKGDEVIGPPPPMPAGPGGAASQNPMVAAALKIKGNPHPEINPLSDTRALHSAQGGLLGRLVALQAAQPQQMEAIYHALDAQISAEATGALSGMTEQLRRVVMSAQDLEDLASKLTDLKLDDAAFAEAMARGMALSHLAGQAALLDEIAHRGA
jgi:phage gp29-like protein